jgi:hypothetical protein
MRGYRKERAPGLHADLAGEKSGTKNATYITLGPLATPFFGHGSIEAVHHF